MKATKHTDLNNLVEKAMQGDRHALSELCRIKGQSVLFLCTKTLGNLQDGEDAAQEVFITMQKKITELRAPEAFTVWLQKLISYTCSNMRRKDMQNKNAVPIDDYESTLQQDNLEFLPEAYINQKEHKQELLGIINDLPEGMRACVYGYYYEHLTTVELAQVLDTSEETVRSQLYRARLRIRSAIQQKNPDAYKGGKLLSMSMIATLLQAEADALIPQAVIMGCLKAAGLSVAGGASAAGLVGGAKGVGMVVSLLAAATITVTGTVVAVTNSGDQPHGTSSPASSYVDRMVLDVPQHTESTANEEDAGEGALPFTDISTPEGASEAGTSPQEVEPDISEPNSKSEPVKVPGGELWTGGTVEVPPEDTTPPARQTEKLQGQMVFVDADGQPVENAGRYGAGYTVRLYTPQGLLAAQATADAGGGFTLEYPTPPQAVEYTLQAQPPYASQGSFTVANPDGVLTLTLPPGGTAEDVQLYITDSEAPSGRITLTGGGLGGRINPTSAEVVVADETQTSTQWRIVRRGSTATLQQGNGCTVSPEIFAALAAQAGAGEYRLVFTMTDAAGNSAEVEKAFSLR